MPRLTSCLTALPSFTVNNTCLSSSGSTALRGATRPSVCSTVIEPFTCSPKYSGAPGGTADANFRGARRRVDRASSGTHRRGNRRNARPVRRDNQDRLTGMHIRNVRDLHRQPRFKMVGGRDRDQHGACRGKRTRSQIEPADHAGNGRDDPAVASEAPRLEAGDLEARIVCGLFRSGQFLVRRELRS